MTTSLEAQRQQLSRLLHQALPHERAAAIESLIRDTIAIRPRKATKLDNAVGASRLGGSPDLPAGSSWPEKAGGAVDFVGQIRLEDLAPLDVHRRLPATGLLSFFHGYLTNGEYEAEARVFHFPESPQGLLRVVPAKRRGGNPKAVGIDFALEAQLPPHSSPWVPFVGPDDPYCEIFDTYYRVHDTTVDTVSHGMLGFTRPYETQQRPDEEVLLRLDAGGVPYDFVEAAAIYYFVPRGHLPCADFSQVRLHEGG